MPKQTFEEWCNEKIEQHRRLRDECASQYEQDRSPDTLKGWAAYQGRMQAYEDALVQYRLSYNSEEMELRYCGKCHAMTNHLRLSDNPKCVEAAAKEMYNKTFANNHEFNLKKAKQILQAAERSVK